MNTTSFHKTIISSPPAHHASFLLLCPFSLAATSRTSFTASDWRDCSQPLASPQPASRAVSTSLLHCHIQPLALSHPASRAVASSLPHHCSKEHPCRCRANKVSRWRCRDFSLTLQYLIHFCYHFHCSSSLQPVPRRCICQRFH